MAGLVGLRVVTWEKVPTPAPAAGDEIEAPPEQAQTLGAQVEALYALHRNGDGTAAPGIAQIFLELNSLRATRALSMEEYTGLIYACHRLNAADIDLAQLLPEYDRIRLMRIRLEQSEKLQVGTGALSAASGLADLLAPTDPDGALELLRDVVDRYPDALVKTPSVLANLYYMESTSVAIKTIEPAVLELLQAPAIQANDKHMATLHGVLADLYIKIGNADDASMHVGEEANFAALSNNSTCLSASAQHRGALLLSINRMKAADRYLSKILDENPEWLLNSTRIRLTFQRGLARAELYREDPELASQGVPDLDAALDSGQLSDHDALKALGYKTILLERLGEEKPAALAYDELQGRIDALVENDDRPHSDPACIAGLMRSRLSTASVEQIRDGLETCVLQLFERVKELEPRPGGAGFFHYGPPRDLISELVERCIDAEPGPAGLERALGWILKSQALGSMARLEAYEFDGFDKVRAALVTGSRGVLVYLPSPIQTHVFGFDSESLWHEKLERAWFIEKHREAFLYDGLYTNERGQNYANLATNLAHAIIPERVLAHMAHWKEVSIGGLGLTDYIPYEVLPFDGKQLFGQRFDVAYLPSVPIGVLLANRALPTSSATAPSIALFLAPTTPAGLEQEFPPIVLSEEQRKRLGCDRPNEVAVWQADAATFMNLRTAAASGAKVLHLFMHGDPDPNRARPAGLLFAASDGSPARVSCQDIENLGQVPPIVILSVCGAQKGRKRKGEDGLTHLGGAFLAAGAQAVILSPDDLEVDGTLALVAFLQDHLLNGEAPARALAGAIEDLKRESAFTDPKFASMHVMGLGFRSFP